MQKDLSFILLIIACVALLILFFYSLKTRVKPLDKTAHEEGLENFFSDAKDDVLTIDLPKKQTLFKSETKIKSKTEPVKPTETVQKPVKRLIALHILPGNDSLFIQKKVIQVLTDNHLVHGPMSIFHQFHEDGKSIIFSVANAREPGTFDLQNDHASCSGLAIFMQLSHEKHDLKALEQFILKAQNIADALNGLLVDEHRQALSNDLTKALKEQVNTHLKTLN